MEILRWQAGNTLKNYQYILCDSEKNAVLLDPLDAGEIARMVTKFSLRPRAIFITHEHDDHAGASVALQQQYKVPVYATKLTADRIRVNATVIDETPRIKISRDLELLYRPTPGHSAGHAAYEWNGFFFSGDCLFHGGCGH